MAAAVPLFQELPAPQNWRTVDFISDLHLQAPEPATFDAWRGYMRNTPADAVFILGDLFEAWAGDDTADQPGFAADCATVLRASAALRAVLFMHGNRDFLVGAAFMASCGVTLLADPTVLSFAGERWLLTHGDALCLGDIEYQRFRAQVRSRGWQQDFLRKPLAQRKDIARTLREQSTARKIPAIPCADVDPHAAKAWLSAAQARTMIHGHTHKPGEYPLEAQHGRTVLSDWDAAAVPPRLEALRLTAAGTTRIALA